MAQANKKKQNHKIDDLSLVINCQNGDLEALNTLLLKYQDRIYSVIYRICLNPDDAAELTQDTFVKVIEKIGDFKLRSTFYTWLYRIAVNLTLNFIKRRASIGFKSIDEALKICDNDSVKTLKSYLNDQGDFDPVKIASQHETRELIYAAISKLEEQHKIVILLREIEALSYSDISEILNVEIGTVKSRVFRARANLREILKEALA